MYKSLSIYARRIIHAFSTRTRVAFTLTFLVLSGWLVSQFVLAQKEMNVYVFPSAVIADGFENETQALGQDLSPDAVLADFSAQNSAGVTFGTPLKISSSTNPGVVLPIHTPTENTSTTSLDSLDITPAIVNVVAPVNGGDIVAPEAPIIPTEVPLQLPNPFIPSEPLPLDVATSAPQTNTGIYHGFLSEIFGVKVALAIDEFASSTGETFSGTTSDEQVDATTSTPTDTPTAPTPMSDDPYPVSSCTTLGLTCHLMSFVGFGLGDNFADKPLTGATLELSLAGRGDVSPATHDRLLVRVFHAGRWEFLGETEVKGEISNAKRGGYLSYELPSISAWKDLADLKVVVEYVREGKSDSAVYVDGLWINAKYSSDSIAGASTPDEVALSAQNVRSALAAKDAESRKAQRDVLVTPEGSSINFTHADAHNDATIVLKTDKETYRTLGNTAAYFNVTNQSDKEQLVRLQFHFPGSGGSVSHLSRYSRSVPYKVSNLKYDDVGYFCASGWGNSSGSTTKDFSCSDTHESRSCDVLNEDKTNCIISGARVGLSEDTEYRDGWAPTVLASGSFRDDAGIFAKALDIILGQLPSDSIPPSQEPVSYIQDAVLLLPGQTAYMRADLALPLNGRGDFYVEAAAESGAYGLVHAGWDGSWNYRVPIDIANDKVETETEFAVPITLDTLPKEFWQRVNSNGSDIRFVDETGIVELPYWLSSWNIQGELGLAWVRIPKTSSASTTRIYAYYGDKDAEPHSDPVAPFRTSDLTPRAVVVGSSQHDMTVLALALGEDTHVRVGGHDVVTLKKGEAALFDTLAPGTTVDADGPLAVSLQSNGGNSAIVPYGYAGSSHIVPGIGGEHTLSLTSVEDTGAHAALTTNGESTAIDVVKGSVVSDTVELTTSLRVKADYDVIALLSNNEESAPAPLYPATDEPFYGFLIGKTTVGYGSDASTMKAVCSSGGGQSVDGRREGMSTNIDHCAISTFPELADTIRISELANPASAIAVANDNITGFLPKSEFASSYTLPEDAKTIALLCSPEDDSDIGVYDTEGLLVASSTCEGRGTRPGKAVISSADGLTTGFIVRSISASSTSFMAAYQPLGRALLSSTSSPLTLLYGAPLFRAHSPNHPRITNGEEEFVIPGEHRKLDIDTEGKERPHVDKLLTTRREFSVHEQPGFQFQYSPQSNSLVQSVRSAFGVAPFSVTKVTLKHPLFGDLDTEYDIGYGDNNTWSLTLKNAKEHLHPGKYTLHVEIEEGGTTYVDEYDFYWGVIAINYNKSVFLSGETAAISIGALSDNGDTICDAQLKLWVTPPAGTENEIPVATSGLCNGNNVVDVPDYAATYKFPTENATGTYHIKLVRFDTEGNVASQVTDSVNVEDNVPVVIEREGPTRIYPVAHYPMKLRVTANQDFKGSIVERLPGDFVLIDRGGADLAWGDDMHTFITATWSVDMKKGAVVSFTYTFDAPDRSPYLYLLGPAKVEGDFVWSEEREWQIASDAVGQTYIYWDQTFIPTGWTCVSCAGGVFNQKFIQGSSTYNGLGGGTSTDTPTANATVYALDASEGSGPVTTNNTTNSPIGHSHTLTPTMSGASNLPPYRNLVILQYSSAGDPAALPTGAIVAFDIASSSLPSGWNRYTQLDGRYPRGESTSTVNLTGGAATSSQSITGTLAAPSESGLRSNRGPLLAATRLHTHTLTATNTSAMNTEPPYVEMLFAKLTATSAPPVNIITMWDNTPSSGWVTLSDVGGTLAGKFTKASSTYGGTGGAILHTYPDIVGATTSVSSASAIYAVSASKGQAAATSTHRVDITNFSSDDTRPPYIDIVFAKRLVGIPFWTQNDYQFYANQNTNTVTDPWPTGASDLDIDTPIDTATTLIKPGDVLRLRMNVGVTNATASPSQAFKLQYVAGTDCVNALNWTDVAPIGSSTALWRGYDNAGVTNGADLSTSTITTSNVAESYVEANNSPVNPATSTIGQFAEWDWALQDNLAVASTNYCFRMVKSDGTPLDAYTNYPQALTNTQPNQVSQSAPFNYQKVSSTLPDFDFVSSDSEADDLDYEIQIDTSSVFSGPIIDKDSTVNPELFDNADNTINKAPFSSGDTIHFKATSALTNGSTYWWRVRAKDSGGSNTWGAWSTSYSFTVDTTVVYPTWHQTTSEQFQADSFSGVNSTSSNAVMLTVGSTTGTVWSPQIDFSIAATGTVWGSLKVASTSPPGTILMHVEYLTSTSSWALIPDADLLGNAIGFTSTSTSLLTVNPDTYPSLRLRADLTIGATTPILLDWSVLWGVKVNAPTLFLPFDNQKVATRTPTFEFLTTDPNSNPINYEISWSTSSSFTSSTTVNSATTSSVFTDMTNGLNSNPFPTGDRISFKIPSYLALSSSTPYYWRVRARDPTSSNVYSFWSDIHSITVDTTVTVSTWFQTGGGQFNSDTLTGVTTFATDTAYVSTTTLEALIGYGESTQQTPKYRIWDGGSWGSQLSAQSVGAQINWVVTKASPITGEYLMGTLGTNNKVNVQVYNGASWGSLQQINTVSLSNAKARGFDIAYETLTGRALVVACNGGVNPVYRIWNSTTSSWSSASTISVTGSNSCQWIKLASNPTSNEITMLERDTGSRYFGIVWNGSTWVTTSTTTVGSITTTANEGMGLDYNASGTRAYAVTSNGASNTFAWKFWSSTSSSWSATATVAMTSRLQWAEVQRDPLNNNNLVACYSDLTAPDIGVSRWTGSAWVANTNLVTTANNAGGKDVSCQFETAASTTLLRRIIVPYSNTVGSQYREWNGNATWYAQTAVSNIGRAWTVQAKRTMDGKILSVFFEHLAGRYRFSYWNGSSWSASTTLEASPSVTASPYLEPFMIAPRNPGTSGTVFSSAVNFIDGNSPAWNQVSWNKTLVGSSTFSVQVQYQTASGTWALIPDTDLSGNSVGTTTSPLNIKTLNTDNYSVIRLVGNMTCVLGNCPTLNDWTVQWATGINISGTIKQHDLTTDETSGTVAIAVNGVLQSGKTGTISGGTWTIPNVNIFSGNTLEVFVQGASTSTRAVAVAVYDGPGDMSGIALNEHWLTIGSTAGTQSSTTLAHLAKYDNSVASTTDIFFDVTAGGDLNMCALTLTSGCFDAGIYVPASNIFQPSTTTAKTVTTFDMRIAGGVYMNANSIKVGGSWRNLGGFTPGSGTVTFNATSSQYAIDSTSAATSTFYNVTFGEAGNTATWTLGSAFIATGTVNMNYGTVSPGAIAMTLQGDLVIGSSGTFSKGTATTTFSGSVAKTWTDNTATKQDLGNVAISGSTKTITLGSSVKATNIQIASGNTMNAGGANTITMVGFWDNSGTFTPQTSTVSFVATSTSKTINQGASNFYNVAFNGVGGAWRWLNTNATTTNDFIIATGTVTLPGGTFELGGSFGNTGGTFINNSGLVKLTSTASGKTIQTGTSTFFDLTYNGAGGAWSFVDTNATTTNTLTILAGTPTFPSGIFEVGNNFTNTSGSFIANGGTVKLTSSLSARSITLGGSSLANLTVQNAGIFTITDTNATTTGDVTFVAGTTTLPTGSFAIGGSLLNTGKFVAGTDLVTFYAASGAKTITTGVSSFGYASINGAGTFTISGNATSTNDFSILSAGGFTQSSGTTLAVGGTFTNLVGGGATTWTGSTLALNSGASYSINTKLLGGDLYGTLRIAPSMQIRSWNSSSTVYAIDTTSSLYSQNHNSVSGEVDIFGAYSRTSGTDYWDYATDFDGTVLSGGARRTATVKFASGATAVFGSGTTLDMVGSSGVSTTSVDRQGSGNYGITLTGATINAQYYQFRNMNTAGLTLSGSTTISSLSYGDFSIDVNAGSGITVSSTTIATNPGLQIFNVKFATSTGISSGFNVTATGTATSYLRFKQHYGNYSGEAFDNDPGPSSGNPGYVRWDDSNFVISISGTVYSDGGVTPMGAPTCDGITSVVRVKVAGQGNYAAPCSNVNGTYTVSGVTFTGDTVMTIYLDTNGGAQAVAVTKSASADLTGVSLYQHRVIVRHEDVTPMSIADMHIYDKTNDSDIPFTAATSGVPYTLTTDPETQLWVWTAKTFVPGGNITLNSGGSGQNYDGSLIVGTNSIFTAQGTESHAIGGGVTINSGATFTTASSTFSFTATTTGKVIIGVAPLSFWKMNFTGIGGGWAISQITTVGDNLTPTAGTVSGTSNVTVNGTSVSGAGSIAMTAGTFTFANGGTFGGAADWSFANLTFGNGTLATTTKNGSSTVTVTGVLTDSASHVFQAGTSSTWVLAGAGTPLVLSGTFTVQNALFRYASNGATIVTPASYAQLDFGANGATSPVYTLSAGTYTIASALNIGVVATNTVTVNATTNDPVITASGNVNIVASSTFILSDTGAITVRRNWSNLGTTTASGGTVTFDATTTGFTINAGHSSFANAVFNNSAGGWTVTADATTTGALTFTALNSFTQSPGTTFEVDGVFTNGVGGSATTWTNATLYLNSGAGETINTKSIGADIYGTLLVGANTAVRMWNSSAATTTVNTTGSLYSMNHANVSGALNIWGSYSHTSGTDYWDYANDFDGTALGTTSSRVVNVRVASSSSMTFSGGTLEAIGGVGATTTIDVLTAGGYAWSVTGGSLNMQYYKVRGADQNGLSISGSPTIVSLGNADFQLAINGATMMTIAGGTIDANPLKTFFGMSFATSSGITSGYNITATGVSGSVWTISGLYGNYAGEARDNDPGGDPGYIRWDDSAAQITVSGAVYSDEGQTPIGSPVCDGVTQNVLLKVQGLGAYTSACNAVTGAFSISNIIYNPKDTLTLFLASSTNVRAVNIAYDPATNITNMNLYQNRVIVRHEQGTAVGIAQMAIYDNNKNSAIPFTATTTGATTTSIFANTGLIVWNSKTFAPGGNMTLHANASANNWDGTIHLYATSTWAGASTESYTVGGQFIADTAATLSAANTTFTFTATTTGKSITASSALTFYNLTENGTAGTLNIVGVGTTTNDLTISAGTLLLPSTSIAVGGSFNNSGGTFVANGGTVQFTSVASGKNIRTGASAFWNTTFSGVGGGWTYLDTNSTTSGTTTIIAGTLTLPTGIYTEGRSFDNQSGAVAANGGTLKMIATSSGQTIRLAGSSLANFTAAATGTFQFIDSNATTTGDVTLSFGTTTFPLATLAVGGSFTNNAVFSAGTSTLIMNATAAGKTIVVGSSSPYNMLINGASGGFTISTNATTTNNFTLQSATTFTQTSGTTLAVGGLFTNLLGGAPTTWAGSVLSLYGTTADYTINTKVLGGDAYDTLRLAAGTNIRMWSSSVTTTQLDPNSSIYSQNNTGSNGSLYIYGNYSKTSGTDYWSYATDFDGSALGSPRQANVRFAANATATYSNGATLQMIGGNIASTTVDRQSSGNYGIILSSAYWNANYYQFRNMNTDGLSLSGTTTIVAMNNGDFSVDVNGGSSITIASTTIDQNASVQYFYDKFATSSGVTSAYNVTRTGNTSNSITFNSEYGPLAGEAFDNDGVDSCGAIRWSDSACLISDERGFRWRNDDGAEGAPSSEWYDQSWTKRQRIRIVNNATSTFSNEQVKLAIPYDGDMKSNFDDIRFTDSSGTTSLPFWTESYITSATATVWVKLSTLPASGTSDIFMYFGNATGTYGGVGTSTFSFFDDFEDGNISEYTGNTTLFGNDATFNYERTYGLAASLGNTGAQNTSGIAQASAGVGRDTTFRFNQYIDMSSGGSDEPCFLFAVQPPVTAHQNYAVCLSPFGADHLVVAKNASWNGRSASDGSTLLVSKAVTYSTGWYQVSVDWISTNNQINVNVYDNSGALFATATTTDATYTSGGVGFTFWGMHGGWDIPFARTYNYLAPSYSFFTKQADSGATWAAAENTYVPNYAQNQNIRLRFSIRNSSLAPLSENFRLEYAAKLAAPNCESVSSGNYSVVPTTTSGCGSDAACMTPSSQFSNKASTTQLLSFPNNYSFTQSQIIKDPSNTTDLISLLASNFTEVEYNFQMTNSSPLDRYCFRVTNAGAVLDNYSHVAELQVLHPPVISGLSFNNNSNIALTEGTTTTIFATGTVSDLNGYNDIVAASSTYYRSSVAGGGNCTADNNNCYQIATSSCSLSSCSGNSCAISCSASMYYFADPTDVVAVYAADIWDALVDVWDTGGAHSRSTANQEVYTLSGLTIPSAINYGAITVGGDSGGSDATTTVTNTGNALLNTRIYANGPGLLSGSSIITPDKQKFATTSFTYSGCALCNILTNSSSTPAFGLGVSKPTSTALFFKDIYWGIAIPNGTAASTHNGSTTFEAIAG